MSAKHFFKGMVLALMLLLGATQVASAQKVTLNFDKAPLKSVLNEIQKQVDYTFVYNDQQIGVNRAVSVNVKEEALTSALDKIFQPLGISYKILDKQIALSVAPAAATAQQGQSGRAGRFRNLFIRHVFVAVHDEDPAGQLGHLFVHQVDDAFHVHRVNARGDGFAAQTFNRQVHGVFLQGVGEPGPECVQLVERLVTRDGEEERAEIALRVDAVAGGPQRSKGFLRQVFRLGTVVEIMLDEILEFSYSARNSTS